MSKPTWVTEARGEKNFAWNLGSKSEKTNGGYFLALCIQEQLKRPLKSLKITNELQDQFKSFVSLPPLFLLNTAMSFFP